MFIFSYTNLATPTNEKRAALTLLSQSNVSLHSSPSHQRQRAGPKNQEHAKDVGHYGSRSAGAWKGCARFIADRIDVLAFDEFIFYIGHITINCIRSVRCHIDVIWAF